MIQTVLLKLALLLGGLITGYVVLRSRKDLQSSLGSFVFNWLLPYVVFVEIASMDLGMRWWSYSLAGAAFVLVPYFVGQWIGLSKYRSALLATAEGGSLGFAIYATLAIAPLSQFFLVDMLGNGLAVFLCLFPHLVGKAPDPSVFMRLIIAMVGGIIANMFGFHPLIQDLGGVGIILRGIEPWLVALLVFLISAVVGAGIRFKASRDILFSRFFGGFWLYRLVMLGFSLYFDWPFAISILFILPPSFLVPVLYRAQRVEETEIVYANNFIAACLPFTIALAAFFFLR